MRFLGFGETNDLGDMYLRLAERGHEVKVYMSDPESAGVMDGMLHFVSEWKKELPWIRDAGKNGFVLFETASDGKLQDELRADGFNVIGGSGLGDRLEADRAFGQQTLNEAGIATPDSHAFESFDDARHFISRKRGRHVLKLNGTNWSSISTYTGRMQTGEDMIAILDATQRRWPDDEPVSFILMEHVDGVEVGVGAFFNGQNFLRPANLDWEHKRFFPGDLGELTGEMGTVVTYRGAEKIFDATLGRLESLLRSSGYCGYINLNTIVNTAGIWPLEFTCRFGYPGFPILDSLHIDRWDEVFAKMISGENTELQTQDGFSVGVVITVPPFPYSANYEHLGKGLPICFLKQTSERERDSIHYGEVALRDGQLVTAGMIGYIAVVTGIGETISAARENAYELARQIVIPNSRYRIDIGEKLVREDLKTLTALGWLSP
ncbi:MAG TPA: phosphoribosylglycinamide synthetase C domain-containing protein [Gemmatimonadaceae bacterium]|nr:phosphoribosylglycinamide synthetase C domain-containing protein [Gemmatimonadaceae bacterium]